MSVTRWRSYAVLMGAGNLVGGLVGFRWTDGVAIESPDVDGTINPTVNAALQIATAFELTFLSIKEVHATTGLKAVDISTLSGGLVMYLPKAGVAGTASGSSHIKLTIAAGMIVPVSITAMQGKLAAISCIVIPFNTGGTNPVAEATAAAPSGSILRSYWTLGPTFVNGTQIEGMQSANISLNNKTDIIFADGSIYPKAGVIESHKPKIMLATVKADAAAVFTPGAIQQTSSDSHIFLKACNANALPFDEADSEHMQLSIDEGIWTREGVEASPNASFAFSCTPGFDGTNEPIAVTADTAIS